MEVRPRSPTPPPHKDCTLKRFHKRALRKIKCPTVKEKPRLHGLSGAPQPIPFRRSTKPRHRYLISSTKIPTIATKPSTKITVRM